MVRVQNLTLFLPRDAMRYSAVFAVVRYPSVRLSITFVHCIQTVQDIVKHLSRSGNPMILVFWTPSTDTQFQLGIPSAGAQNTRVGKICDFRLKSPFISETIQE